MLFFTRFLSVFFLAVVSVQAATDVALDESTYAKQRELYQQALNILQTGDSKQYAALKKKLEDYPLYPYLVYQELLNRLPYRSDKEINDFLHTWQDTPMADRLRSKWLSQLAKTKKWKSYLAFYQPDSGISLECHYLNALLETGQQDKAMSETSKLWLHGSSRPKACDPVFKQWQARGLQTDALTWKRIALALEGNELRLARYLAKSLPAAEIRHFDQWLEARKNPQNLTLKSIPASHPFRQEVYADGIVRLSRKNLEDALSLWDELKIHIVDQPELISRVERTIALQFLDEPLLEHFDYLVFTEPCDSDSKLQEIRIRAALLHESWQEVIHWIDRLPGELKQDERWQYWRARALDKLGHKKQARALFVKVAETRSFYGFMAADRLKQEYELNHADTPVEEEVMQDMLALPAVRRTFELIQLDEMLDARREWYLLTEMMEGNELLALARIAHDWQWDDRAIMTLARAKAWNDLSIRFPVRYESTVMHEAENNDLDPAWIFAMMRQESAFMQDARSSVGALGLMQLMPKTADSVARKLKQSKPAANDIIKPERNIQLGSAYLKQVYDRFEKHPVLAIASYNAGPHRVQNWLPEVLAMPADIWIEMIPFRETRNYVKSVLAYTVIYGSKLGKDNIRMKDRMPEVPARNSGKLAKAGSSKAG